MAKLELSALSREANGTGASRRLRREQDMVLGVIYGGGEDNESVMFQGKDVVRLLKEETAYSHAVTIKREGGGEVQAVLREIQRHPARGDAMHLDFMRVDAKRAVKVKVPLHFLNAEKSVGVRLHAGRVSHSLTEVEVSCLPGLIPDFLEVDMLAVNVRESVHLSDLELPEGVSIVALQYGEAHDLPVASVQPPRGGADEDEELDAEGEEPGAEEVEAVKQKGDDADGEGGGDGGGDGGDGGGDGGDGGGGGGDRGRGRGRGDRGRSDKG